MVLQAMGRSNVFIILFCEDPFLPNYRTNGVYLLFWCTYFVDFHCVIDNSLSENERKSLKKPVRLCPAGLWKTLKRNTEYPKKMPFLSKNLFHENKIVYL
jgi:hypothetical protein